jgi:hypothetical protein
MKIRDLGTPVGRGRTRAFFFILNCWRNDDNTPRDTMPVCSLKDNDFDFSRLPTVLTADGARNEKKEGVSPLSILFDWTLIIYVWLNMGSNPDARVLHSLTPLTVLTADGFPRGLRISTWLLYYSRGE